MGLVEQAVGTQLMGAEERRSRTLALTTAKPTPRCTLTLARMDSYISPLILTLVLP